MRHETNTFSPIATNLDSFFDRFGWSARGGDSLLYGEEALEMFRNTGTPFAAFVAAAVAHDADVDVPLYANAHPSAPVDRASFEIMAEAIVDSISQGCDAALLDLHGAMVAEDFDDAEGELLRRIRDVAPDLPIAVALDFHSNLSDGFFDAADIVCGYRTYPHVDTFETGERAARSLFRWLNGGSKPVMAYRRLPMLTHMNCQTPAREPMRSIMDRAIQAESEGEVWNASVFGGFPLADVPNAGLLTVTVSASKDQAETLADELAHMAWQRRADFVYSSEPVADTISKAAELDRYPVILADHGNNCGAGGSVDTMAVYAEILKQELDNVIAGPVCDPVSVQIAIDAGIGAEINLEVGGKTDMPAINLKGEPLVIEGRVRAITDGRFVITGPMFTGVEANLGRTVVIDAGPMKLVISENRVEPFDLGVFTHCGLDPTHASYVLVHSRQHFKAGFEHIAGEILLVAGPGVCTSDYDSLPFANLTRPMYPLDRDARWPLTP